MPQPKYLTTEQAQMIEKLAQATKCRVVDCIRAMRANDWDEREAKRWLKLNAEDEVHGGHEVKDVSDQL